MQGKKVVFARIGYMKYYKGPQGGDDKPVGGGKYNEAQIGHEAYNFKNVQGVLYGYVQPYIKDIPVNISINLRRIDPACLENRLDDVLVIFFATRPEAGGQVIVGWYKNATVYRDYQKPGHGVSEQRNDYYFLMKARASDAVLLPSQKREFLIAGSGLAKAGRPGQANIYYTLEANGREKDTTDSMLAWIDEAVRYVKGYQGPNLLDDPLHEAEEDLAELAENALAKAKGQGFNSSPEARKAVENHAMGKAKEYLMGLGYKKSEIEDVSLTRSYDLHCHTSGNLPELLVEVKGTQSQGASVFLTKNEANLARNNKGKMALFLLHSITVTGKGKNCAATGGIAKILKPWDIEEGQLKPVTYLYTLD